MEDQSISFSLTIPTTAMSGSVHSLAPCFHSIDKLFGSISPLHAHHISGVAVANSNNVPLLLRVKHCAVHITHITS